MRFGKDFIYFLVVHCFDELELCHVIFGTFGRRAFAVAAPTAWNSLPDDLRNLSCCDSYFGRFLKSILFSY